MSALERRPEVVNAINRLFAEPIADKGPIPDDEMEVFVEQYEEYEALVDELMTSWGALRVLTMSRLHSSLVQDAIMTADAVLDVEHGAEQSEDDE